MKAKGRGFFASHIFSPGFPPPPSHPGHFCDIKSLVIFSKLKKKVVEFSLEKKILQRKMKFLS
jgi:hypothetical protein